MVTSAREWKSKKTHDSISLDLPSGNTALVRAIQPEAFLTGGMLPDTLTSMVQKAIASKKGLPPNAIDAMAKDPKQLAAALETFDRALVYCVVEPVVEMAPVCTVCAEPASAASHISRQDAEYHRYSSPERDDDVLYADQVDMEDKQFIFQWAVGGTADVERFRRELAANVGSVATG